jgi:hypothetical protein
LEVKWLVTVTVAMHRVKRLMTVAMHRTLPLPDAC